MLCQGKVQYGIVKVKYNKKGIPLMVAKGKWDSRQYTKRQKTVISKIVITHWIENLLLAYAGELRIEDVYGSKCEFCQLFYSTPKTVDHNCQYCPLNIWSFGCNDERSSWDNVYVKVHEELWGKRHEELKDNIIIIKYVEEMLKTLEYVCDEWINSPAKETK